MYSYRYAGNKEEFDEYLPEDLDEDEDEQDIQELMALGLRTNTAEPIAPSTTMIKNQLFQVFQSLEGLSAGSFALSSKIDNAPSPGLFVRSVGSIGLPLSTRDAHLIAQACHQAPFGQGSETVVDRTVRNTWELNADQFEFRNSLWTKFVNGLSPDLAKGLGIPEEASSMQLQLYKLLLYEKGAFFNKHREFVLEDLRGI